MATTDTADGLPAPPWFQGIIAAPFVAFIVLLVSNWIWPSLFEIYGDDVSLTDPSSGHVAVSAIGLAAPAWTAFVCRQRRAILVDAVFVVFCSAVATLMLFEFGPLLLWVASCELSGERCT